jgi:hypothetical protein
VPPVDALEIDDVRPRGSYGGRRNEEAERGQVPGARRADQCFQSQGTREAEGMHGACAAKSDQSIVLRIATSLGDVQTRRDRHVLVRDGHDTRGRFCV